MDHQLKNIPHIEIAGQKIPFEIISFKDLYRRHQDTPNLLFDCHRIQFNALFIILSGKSQHSIDCEKYPMQAGTIIPMVKGQVHHFEKNLNIEGIVITFPDNFITENISENNLFQFLQLYHSPILNIDTHNISLLNPLIEQLFTIQESENSNLKLDFIKSTFISLVIQLIRLTPIQSSLNSTKNFMDFVRFKQLLKNKYTQTHNANDYAQELGISYKVLNSICKANANKTAKAFIDHWLVLEIKRNIAEHTTSIKEIAFNTGFDEPTNLIRFFKKHTGFTPKQYAESLTSNS
ncbi:MAG: AraC family transcriptional regulator [Marinifilaceae bacterium]|jgi:AraC-like DNA-binding protein|nr:AraC family transcriptional regulator [Marinifilaceae bacterium]